MSLRETLNKHPKSSAVIVLLVIAASVAFALQNGGVIGDDSGISGKHYYSVDDGQSYFADAADRIPPFDHGGKPAYRAYVYRFGSGKPFVAYLERVSPDGQNKLAAGQIAGEQAAEIAGQHTEIRKPGEAKWVRFNSPEGGQVMSIRGSADGGELEPIFP